MEDSRRSEEPGDCGLQRRKVAVDDVEDALDLDPGVLVCDHVSQPGDIAPGNLRRRRLRLLRQVLHRFADDDELKEEGVVDERLVVAGLREAQDVRSDGCDRFGDVL